MKYLKTYNESLGFEVEPPPLGFRVLSKHRNSEEILSYLENTFKDLIRIPMGDKFHYYGEKAVRETSDGKVDYYRPYLNFIEEKGKIEIDKFTYNVFRLKLQNLSMANADMILIWYLTKKFGYPDDLMIYKVEFTGRAINSLIK